MKYAKPLASSAASVIEATQCSTQKTFHLFWDSLQIMKPMSLATVMAYGADE